MRYAVKLHWIYWRNDLEVGYIGGNDLEVGYIEEMIWKLDILEEMIWKLDILEEMTMVIVSSFKLSITMLLSGLVKQIIKMSKRFWKLISKQKVLKSLASVDSYIAIN
ncbi:hypothetical protein CEXT_62471 [Caerostris extrusa]|uniref:Uncharacterized protein n=1 Tax=Caerostris extrusa TaxID=172846 RepID=A0AAV4M6W8_CAEEX|nr:hypothetical protein CEXT_62471 [Caerostris extrusa]